MIAIGDIHYSKSAVKFLMKQDVGTKRRIVNAIEKLPAGDVVKLQGRDGYRLRVGDFRVVFQRDGDTVDVEKIDSRGQVYKA